jgi:hypothetical protein
MKRRPGGQVERLEQVFELIGSPARGKKCDAIEGILDEGTKIMQEYKGSPALDAGLLAAAQAVEHYEISRYGTLKAWAGKLVTSRPCRCSTKPCSRKRKLMPISRRSPKRQSTPKLNDKNDLFLRR